MDKTCLDQLTRNSFKASHSALVNFSVNGFCGSSSCGTATTGLGAFGIGVGSGFVVCAGNVGVGSG